MPTSRTCIVSMGQVATTIGITVFIRKHTCSLHHGDPTPGKRTSPPKRTKGTAGTRNSRKAGAGPAGYPAHQCFQGSPIDHERQYATVGGTNTVHPPRFFSKKSTWLLQALWHAGTALVGAGAKRPLARSIHAKSRWEPSTKPRFAENAGGGGVRDVGVSKQGLPGGRHRSCALSKGTHTALWHALPPPFDFPPGKGIRDGRCSGCGTLC